MPIVPRTLSLYLIAEGQAHPMIGLIPVVIALVLVFVWHRSTKRKRLIEDVPTSKVKGVAIGLTEVKGHARIDEPHISYLAGRPCVWYRYEVEEHWRRTTTESYTDSNGNRRTRTKTESGWKTVQSNEVRGLFYLEDETGKLRINPKRAEIDGEQIFGETVRKHHPLYYGKGPSRGIANSTGRRRFSEYAIPVGDRIYVMGTARVRTDAVAAEIAYDEDAPMFLISTRNEQEITSGYGVWSTVSAVLGTVLMAFGGGFLYAVSQRVGAGEAGTLLTASGAGLGYVLLLSALYAVLLYNGLVRVRERISKSWAMIEVQLKRRADLIPRLAAVVKGYADHEKEVQAGLAELRADALSGRAHTPRKGEVAEAQRVADGQTAMLTRVLAVVEAYPDLKANELYLNLQRELSDTEDRIALARSFYNDTVTAYNERIATLPDVLFARLMALGRVRHYEIEAFERRPVDVRLSPAD